MGRIVLGLSGLVLCGALLGADAAWAADEEEKGRIESAKALLVEVSALQKAKDASGLTDAMPKLTDLHNTLQDGSTRGKLQKAAGAVLKDKKLAEAHEAALDALSGMNDPKGVYKQIKKRLPNPKSEEVDAFDLRAIQAVGKLTPDSAIADLLTLAEKAKDHKAGAAAVTALCQYKTSKKRASVLEGLVKLIGRFQPPKGQVAGEATMKRWEVMGPALIGGLNHMTGQKHRDGDEWIAFYRANKKRPDEMFVADE